MEGIHNLSSITLTLIPLKGGFKVPLPLNFEDEVKKGQGIVESYNKWI